MFSATLTVSAGFVKALSAARSPAQQPHHLSSMFRAACDGRDVSPPILPDMSRLLGDLQLDPAEPPQALQPIDQLVEGLRLGGAAARGKKCLSVLAAYGLQDFELFGCHPSSRSRRQAAVRPERLSV
jgi:hypothetical protein